MARTAITPVDIFSSSAAYNLTDSSDFQTLSTGSGNGVEFEWKTTGLVFLKNDTGGSADFTVKVPTPSTYSGYTTIVDDTVTVADGKTYPYKLSSILKQSDGKVYIDCDVAGKVLPVESFTNA